MSKKNVKDFLKKKRMLETKMILILEDIDNIYDIEISSKDFFKDEKFFEEANEKLTKLREAIEEFLYS